MILPDGQISRGGVILSVESYFLFFRKYFVSRSTQITSTTAAVLSQERGVAQRHQRWERDAVDAGGASDEGAERGRRSRVVLTPRRWRQVLREDARDDGDKKARSPGRARYKP
jgi:hypothetical protein